MMEEEWFQTPKQRKAYAQVMVAWSAVGMVAIAICAYLVPTGPPPGYPRTWQFCLAGAVLSMFLWRGVRLWIKQI
jgi:hypothetical protein